MNRTFGATFLVVDCMIDAPIRGIITVNANDEIVNVDIDGITRNDLPDACEIRAEDNDRRIYDTWECDDPYKEVKR